VRLGCGLKKRERTKATPVVKQELFNCTTPQGEALTFVILNDDRCALMLDGQIIESAGPDADSVNRLVEEFLKRADNGKADKSTQKSARRGRR
jgi:hypothetical protein